MSRHFQVNLRSGSVNKIPKKFDLVSADHRIVGDAKYYTMVRGTSIPPAKFSTIAEYVWLMEKTEAPITFLVFGNDRRVPEYWLEKYGHLVDKMQFFFLDGNNQLYKLR